jgi:ubiquinone biosynthesis protein COQ4
MDSAIAIPASPPARPIRWRHAFFVLRQLVAEPERTEKVFELFDAIGGNGQEASFRGFARSDEGRGLLRDKPPLVDAMADRAALAALADGSLGRAYLGFAVARDFAADGLVEIGQTTGTNDGLDSERRYYYERFTAMHDLWHVLTGYGTDHAGEAALLSFTQGQSPSRAVRLILLAAAWLLPWGDALACQRYLLRAWLRGRRAQALDRAPWEALLALPLDEVRRRLAIEPLARAHPQGVLQGNRNAGELRWVAA